MPRTPDPKTPANEAALRANHALWQDWAQTNFDSKLYDVDGFRRGGRRIPELEQRELGDVRGRSLLHLQCHFGLDTLSWARLGARVSGIDFSEHAIALARGLAQECGLAARFECGDVCQAASLLGERFEIVYTSHGVLGWLPELRPWAAAIADSLAPGGVFYLMEMHPLMWMVQERTTAREIRLEYRYFAEREPVRIEYQGCYSEPEAAVRSVEYVWSHPLSEILGVLSDVGLELDFLHEFPFMKWQHLPFMERDAQGWWRLPPDMVQLPCMFSLRARRP